MTDIRLDHVVIAVSDWDRSTDFYRAVVGAEVIDRGAGRVCFRIGETQLNVHGPGIYPKANVARLPVRPGNSDICFRWDGPIEEAVAHLRRHGVEVETGPVPRPGAGGRTEHGRLRVVAELIVRAPGHAARARLRQGLGPDSASGGRGSAAKPGPLSGGQGFSLV